MTVSPPELHCGSALRHQFFYIHYSKSIPSPSVHFILTHSISADDGSVCVGSKHACIANILNRTLAMSSSIVSAHLAPRLHAQSPPDPSPRTVTSRSLTVVEPCVHAIFHVAIQDADARFTHERCRTWADWKGSGSSFYGPWNFYLKRTGGKWESLHSNTLRQFIGSHEVGI
jgi:hypothetical protein